MYQDPYQHLHFYRYDQSLLAGEQGPAARFAMSILVRMAQVWRYLLNISGAHIDSTIYIGAAGLEFAERLAMGEGSSAHDAECELGLDDTTGRSGLCRRMG